LWREQELVNTQRPMQACSQQKSKSKGQIKRSQPSATPVGSRSAQEQVGWQAAFASKLAPTEKQNKSQTPHAFHHSKQ
jgi:hypothetical protein